MTKISIKFLIYICILYQQNEIKALHISATVFGALAVLAAFIGGILACLCACSEEGLEEDTPYIVRLFFRFLLSTS